MNTQQDMLIQSRCSADTLDAVRELLPEFVLECAELIGMDATKRLIKHLGGLDFRMPKGKQDSGREKLLVHAVGQAAATTLMAVYGGDRVYVPRCDDAFRKLRNMQFVAAIDASVSAGMTQTAAIQQHAPLFGFSERLAYTLLRQHLNEQTVQFSLLDE